MNRELNNEFSWKTATFMAKLSYHAYDGLDEFKKVFKEDWESINQTILAQDQLAKYTQDLDTP